MMLFRDSGICRWLLRICCRATRTSQGSLCCHGALCYRLSLSAPKVGEGIGDYTWTRHRHVKTLTEPLPMCWKLCRDSPLFCFGSGLDFRWLGMPDRFAFGSCDGKLVWAVQGLILLQQYNHFVWLILIILLDFRFQNVQAGVLR